MMKRWEMLGALALVACSSGAKELASAMTDGGDRTDVTVVSSDPPPDANVDSSDVIADSSTDGDVDSNTQQQPQPDASNTADSATYDSGTDDSAAPTDSGVDAYDAGPVDAGCISLTKAQACGANTCGLSTVPVGCGLPAYNCGDCTYPNACEWNADAGYGSCSNCHIDSTISAICTGGQNYPNGYIDCPYAPGICNSGTTCSGSSCQTIYCCM